jgi:hypothetical protein
VAVQTMGGVLIARVNVSGDRGNELGDGCDGYALQLALGPFAEEALNQVEARRRRGQEMKVHAGFRELLVGSFIASRRSMAAAGGQEPVP